MQSVIGLSGHKTNPELKGIALNRGDVELVFMEMKAFDPITLLDMSSAPPSRPL